MTGLEALTNTLLSVARKPFYRLFQAQLVMKSFLIRASIFSALAKSWAWMLYRHSKSEPSSESSASISEPKVSPGGPKCNPQGRFAFQPNQNVSQLWGLRKCTEKPGARLSSRSSSYNVDTSPPMFVSVTRACWATSFKSIDDDVTESLGWLRL